MNHYFSDGILWADVGPRPQALAILQSWGKALGWSVTDIAQFHDITSLGKALQATIGQRRMVLIMDDIWQVEDAFALKIGGQQCSYLVTTRLPIVAHQPAYENTVVVPELSDDDSFKLLQQLTPESTASTLDSIRSLMHYVGGLPLALTLIGHHLRLQELSRQPRRVQTALRELQQRGMRFHLSLPVAPADAPNYLKIGMPISLGAVISISIQSLSTGAQNLLHRLVVFSPKPNNFTEDAAFYIYDGEMNEFVRGFDELIDNGLLEISTPERYCINQTIVDYMTTVHNALFQMAQERVVHYYVAFVEKNSKNFMRLDDEFSNVATALVLAGELHLWDMLITGITLLMPYGLARGHYTFLEKQLEAALEGATILKDSHTSCQILIHLGNVVERAGNYAQAKTCSEQALMLAQQVQSPSHIAQALFSLATIAHRQGKNELCRQLYEESLVIAQDIKQIGLMTQILSSLGYVMTQIGENDIALHYLQKGLAIARSHQQDESMYGFLLNLGALAGMQGNYAEAEGYLQEALSCAQAFGNREQIILAWTNLGVSALDQGDLKKPKTFS